MRVVAALVADDTAAILDASTTAPDAAAYEVALHVDSRNGSLRRAAKVTVVAAQADQPAHVWAVTIAPIGAERLLPHFEGTVAAAGDDRRTDLVLSGQYQPPLGPVGSFGDGLVGHRLVRQSLQRFIDDIAARVEEHARRVVRTHASTAPAPVPDSWLG